jgi:glycerol kinase
MPQPKKTILAIDQGTTSSRAILFSETSEILSIRQKELQLFYPQKGWVEQNPEDIWADTLWACEDIIKTEKSAENIAAVGITNQRETTIIWDRKTGKPIYNAIVWQDRRTADFCAALKLQGREGRVRSRTGLLIDPYFSATKIKWILDHVDGARAKAEAGDLAFGTVDCFLLWRLTQGKVHATDATNASRTMIYNIVEQKWDEELLELFDIPQNILPAVHDNCYAFGHTTIAEREFLIGGMAGDQQAALIGQACFQEGMVKSTYGTGCFALMNIGNTFKESQNRLLTTIAYRLSRKVTYAIEGSIFVAGAAVQWLRDNLGLFKNAAESEILATSVPDNNDVYFVPAFTGLGAPYWQPDAKAAITGLSRESNKAHITRAALEAQAYQTHDLMSAFEHDSQREIENIRVDGGLVANKFVCQFLSDILKCPIEVPEITETTALGAAYLAGLQVGIYQDLDDISRKWKRARSYTSMMDENRREILISRWEQEIERVLYKK